MNKGEIQQNSIIIDGHDGDNSNRIKDSWECVKEAVRNGHEISKNTYDFWIDPLVFDGCENGIAQICIPRGMEHCIGYLSDEYMDYFKTAIKETLNLNVDIRFITKTESEKKRIKLNYGFENFMVNQTNHFAMRACKSFAESVGSSINPLLIYGNDGVGKTHLVQATFNHILDRNPKTNLKYVTSENFVDDCLEVIIHGGDDTSEFRKEYRSLDILILDNLEYINNKLTTSRELFYTTDDLLRNGKSIIFTSNCNPKYLFDDYPEFKVRLEGFCSIGIDSPDDDLISQIVDRTLNDMDFSVTAEIRDYIIEYGDGSIRKTIGALKTLKAYADIENSNPWLQDVKRLFEGFDIRDTSAFETEPGM